MAGQCVAHPMWETAAQRCVHVYGWLHPSGCFNQYFSIFGGKTDSCTSAHLTYFPAAGEDQSQPTSLWDKDLSMSHDARC